jgi:hypothetical protein
MKKVLAMLALAVGLVVVAASVGQAAVTTNVREPLAVSGFVPCAAGGAGETVALTGFVHRLVTFTINGNRISGKVHSQPQGVSGVGLTTGDKYQGTGVTQEQFSGSLVNGQFQETFINNFRVIGQGPGNNLLIHETVHMTVNANGIFTAFVENINIDCK